MLQLKLGKNSLPKPVAKDWLSLDPREISEIKSNLKLSCEGLIWQYILYGESILSPFIHFWRTSMIILCLVIRRTPKSHTHLASVVGRLDINAMHRINR